MYVWMLCLSGSSQVVSSKSQSQAISIGFVLLSTATCIHYNYWFTNLLQNVEINVKYENSSKCQAKANTNAKQNTATN